LYHPSILNPTVFFFTEIRPHAVIARNDCVKALAKYQAFHINSLTAEIINCTAGTGGNPFFDVIWLTLEEANKYGSGNETSQHSTRSTYHPNPKPH